MTENKPVKQVIVMRKDLKMRRGKEIAQGSHASIKDLVLKFREGKTVKDLDEAEKSWYFGNFRKICVYVNSLQELQEVFQKAKNKNLRAHMIIDAGLTEFNGVPTETCICIGPHFDEDFIGITDNLSLL